MLPAVRDREDEFSIKISRCAPYIAVVSSTKKKLANTDRLEKSNHLLGEFLCVLYDYIPIVARMYIVYSTYDSISRDIRYNITIYV